MANRTITSANAVVLLSVAGLFAIPQQMQGFAADDIFDTDPIEPGELLMGVDGRLSAGFVPRESMFNINLQADSPSVDFFETWLQAEKQAGEKLICTGTVTLSSVGKTYAMTKGFLMSIPQIAGAKKVLQPRRFRITFEDISPAVI